jgi:predicted deacylase
VLVSSILALAIASAPQPAEEPGLPERHAEETLEDEGTPAERRKPFVIGGVTIGDLEKRQINIRASESFSAGDVEVPVVVVRGEQPGPVLCLIAGIHGDELNGIEIVRRVVDAVEPGDIHGTVIGVPIVNLFGFWNQSRYLPDRRDLNRHFPGRAQGSTASRIAHRFWSEVVQKCTHMVDFHTGSLHRTNLPQVRGDLSDPEVAALAHAFGGGVIVHNPGLKHTLRAAAVEAGIPTILYEAGETMRFQRDHIKHGVAGVRRVMRHLGVVRGPEGPFPRVKVFLETHWVRARQGGIVELTPRLGKRVKKGDVVGIVTDPLRQTKGTVTTRWSGVVIGKVLAPTVLPGLALLHIGVVDGDISESEAITEEIDEERPE